MFSACYEHAAQFLCTYAAPKCGALAFPEFPCRSMCREFKARCAHELSATAGIDRLIDCNSLADDHLNPAAQCFKLNHTIPTIAPPTNGECTEDCLHSQLEVCREF